ncbi:hypothetical protein LCGC14_2846240 [marine sediment metagenome]|uniref:Uncharacterized protein n=1 Tax=marine sediment metagenome TaxID=412755 RepID=A0A0F8YWE8_9ZZZZ
MAGQDKKELFVVKILNNGLRTKDIATGEYISLKNREKWEEEQENY